MIEQSRNYFENNEQITDNDLEYNSNRIYDYHLYPALNYYDIDDCICKPDKSKRYFGLELEREINKDNYYAYIREFNDDYEEIDYAEPDFHNYDAYQTLLQWLDNHEFHTLKDYVWASKDSSINYGLEFITHPCTLEHWLNTDTLERICDKLKSTTDHSEVGLHIHVSKNFTTMQQCLIALFVTVHKDIFERFADRAENEYCSHEHLDLVQRQIRKSGKPTRTFFTLYDILVVERTNAVNISKSKPTIEFRLFKSSKDVKHIKNCLLFCDSICNYMTSVYKRTSNNACELIDIMQDNKNTDFKDYLKYLKSVPMYSPLHIKLEYLYILMRGDYEL